MRTGLQAPRRHNENDVTITIAGLWRYGDWRHVATGCTAIVIIAASRVLLTFYTGQSAVDALRQGSKDKKWFIPLVDNCVGGR